MKRACLILAACSGAGTGVPHRGGISIDRFSDKAGHLLVRGPDKPLPGPDQPIDFDRAPFLTQGLGPDGSPVKYYNFDIQSPEPAALLRFVQGGKPVEGQLDVVDVLPGDSGYSDFWRISLVEVPADFVAGSIKSAADARALPAKPDSHAIDCPIVPRGSTAREGHGVAPAVTTELWYRGQKVTCLLFGSPLDLDGGKVPTSPIYVTFAKNPGTPSGGPASGFRTESATPQTHNVVFSVPGDTEYSPLWAVHIYDHAAFDKVHDASSASAAPYVQDGPLVNCPIVYVGYR